MQGIKLKPLTQAIHATLQLKHACASLGCAAFAVRDVQEQNRLLESFTQCLPEVKTNFCK